MQITYPNEQGQLYAGALADSGIKDVVSMRNDHSAAIPFGVAVAQGSTHDAVVVPANVNNIIVGIAVHSHTQNNQNELFPTQHVGFGAAENSQAGIPQNQYLSVLKRGRVWVYVEEDIAMGDAVYCRVTASGGNTILGAFRNDADTATCGLVANARWVAPSTHTGLGRVAMLEIGLPVVTMT
jgi:hypothetical protein